MYKYVVVDFFCASRLMLIGQFSNLVNSYVNSKLNLCYGAYLAVVVEPIILPEKYKLPHQIKMPKTGEFLQFFWNSHSWWESRLLVVWGIDTQSKVLVTEKYNAKEIVKNNLGVNAPFIWAFKHSCVKQKLCLHMKFLLEILRCLWNNDCMENIS